MKESDAAGAPPADDVEADRFLCLLAAQSINDAVLMLAEAAVPSEVLGDLQRSLEVVKHAAGAPEVDHFNELSATAIEDLEMLREEIAIGEPLRWPVRPTARQLTPGLQSAVRLMFEAMSHLDGIGGLDVVVHLQLAIDRALGSQQVAFSSSDVVGRLN